MASDGRRSDGTNQDGNPHMREGRTAVRTALGKELAPAGYYRLERRRLLNGMFQMGSAISEDPVPSWAEQYRVFAGRAVSLVEQMDGSFLVRYPDGSLHPDGFPPPELLPSDDRLEDDETAGQTGDQDPAPGEDSQVRPATGFPIPVKPTSGKARTGFPSPLGGEEGKGSSIRKRGVLPPGPPGPQEPPSSAPETDNIDETSEQLDEQPQDVEGNHRPRTRASSTPQAPVDEVETRLLADGGLDSVEARRLAKVNAVPRRPRASQKTSPGTGGTERRAGTVVERSGGFPGTASVSARTGPQARPWAAVDRWGS